MRAGPRLDCPSSSRAFTPGAQRVARCARGRVTPTDARDINLKNFPPYNNIFYFFSSFLMSLKEKEKNINIGRYTVSPYNTQSHRPIRHDFIALCYINLSSTFFSGGERARPVEKIVLNK
jgi:hypothetical protein